MEPVRKKIKEYLNAALEQGDTPRDFLKRLAEKTRISYWKLIKLINPEEDTPVDMADFVSIYWASGGRIHDALACFVETCDPSQGIVTYAITKPDGNFDDEKDDLAVTAGHLVEQLRAAVKDHRVDESERRRGIDLALELRAIADRFIGEINALAEKSR